MRSGPSTVGGVLMAAIQPVSLCSRFTHVNNSGFSVVIDLNFILGVATDVLKANKLGLLEIGYSFKS